MSEPRYTIEQIELLRRLVRTGLTKDEIIHACDSMAKMDSELGPLPSRMEQPIVTSVTSAASPPISSYHAPQQLTVTNRNSGLDTTGGLGQEPASPGNRTSLVTLLSNAGHGFQENGDGGDGGRGGVDDFHVTNEEVEALFRKGHMNVKEDIKDFLTRNRLSQNLISQSTGISQSYISQFLLHGYVMRRSTQAILYRWFLAKKRELEVMGVINSTPVEQDNSASSPHGLAQHRVRPLQPRYAPYQAPTQSTPTNSSAANSGKRRERFVWKDNCLRVLEAYFKKNPYPNDMERIRLSDACNALQQSLLGNDIPEHSRVNPSKVYNWFANRRKDANRKKRMAAEPLITRTVSHDDDSIPEVDYIDDSSADLTNEGDTCMAGELEDERDDGSMMNHMGGDDDQDDAEVATQLVEVNNSIMTLMKAVEERTEDPQVKTEADT